MEGQIGFVKQNMFPLSFIGVVAVVATVGQLRWFSAPAEAEITSSTFCKFDHTEHLECLVDVTYGVSESESEERCNETSEWDFCGTLLCLCKPNALPAMTFNIAITIHTIGTWQVDSVEDRLFDVTPFSPAGYYTHQSLYHDH